MGLSILTEADSPRWAAALRVLGPECPPALHTLGDARLLECAPLVALMCSVRCPGDLILAAYDLARRLRDEGVAVIGGFHAPMEREALRILLRGEQPVIICPARGLEGMRMPTAYRAPLAQGRLLLLSPFAPSHRRLTSALATERNRLVGALADRILVIHAEPGGRLEAACGEFLAWGKDVRVVDSEANAGLLMRARRPQLATVSSRVSLKCCSQVSLDKRIRSASNQ
jgi:predicted Rossmann fold nucleotide-binding protein DprA/Smf involved in DNA uptake